MYSVTINNNLHSLAVGIPSALVGLDACLMSDIALAYPRSNSQVKLVFMYKIKRHRDDLERI